MHHARHAHPNATDADRPSQLTAEPLLEGGKAAPAKGMPDTSANWNVRRASVALDGQQKPDDVTTLSVAATTLALARTDGWSIVSVACKADTRGLASATIVALKKLDGFTAGVEITVLPSGWSARAYAPFHLQKANHWTPQKALATGASCVESATAPTEES
ncbi:hypothetical protein [Glaciihabitans sp. UYNi722]|uniref:hypothetical protein n=1 Tax=Glaciihabitans sp. UYNi722 TaxID=3156344 RepID=UPI003392C0DA